MARPANHCHLTGPLDTTQSFSCLPCCSLSCVLTCGSLDPRSTAHRRQSISHCSSPPPPNNSIHMHGTVTVVWDIIHPSDLWSLSSILLRGRSQFGGLYSPCRSLTGVGVCERVAMCICSASHPRCAVEQTTLWAAACCRHNAELPRLAWRTLVTWIRGAQTAMMTTWTRGVSR